jgi:glutamine amidotransferase
MKVAILKYNAGNTASVANALQRLGVTPAISEDAEILRSADKVIIPGVGEASTAMAHLRERGLDAMVRSLTQPVLGVCLGMQLMCAESEENNTKCLGIFPYRVRRFSGNGIKVPHMGWNTISELRSSLFDGIARASYLYFVHGYYVEAGEQTTATCTYDDCFSAAISRANFHGVQFHPEKSGAVGQTILENFLKL